MSSLKVICVTVLLPCLVGQTFAATSEWAAVQSLAAGERIEVSLATGKTLNGNIDHVTAEAVYLQSRTQTVAIRCDEISGLYTKKKKSWIKPVLIGSAVGAAAAGIAAPKTLEHETGYAGAVAGTVAFGALIGAGVGYLAKGSGKSLVYESARGR
ncbi:MAG: hypothetical protein HY236_09950 [Acidobacteria bacterium]|nr:hypothetical protein [Acidobacteriota bacterium]